MIRFTSLALAARTHVRLLPNVPGQPSVAVKLFHAGTLDDAGAAL